MEVSVLLKIKEDAKLYDYLLNNSYFYRLLNRDSNNLNLLLDSYKKYKREVSSNKINETIDNIDTISNIIKLM